MSPKRIFPDEAVTGDNKIDKANSTKPKKKRSKKKKKKPEPVAQHIPEEKPPEEETPKEKKKDVAGIIKKILLFLIFLITIAIFLDVRLVIFLVVILALNSKVEEFFVMNGIPARIELGTFGTVIATVVFDVQSGIVLGVATRFFASIYTKNVAPDHIFQAVAYVAAAIAAFIFQDVNIIILGLGVTAVVNVIMFFVGKIIGLDNTMNLTLITTNVIGNFIFFMSLSEVLLAVLGV